MGGFEKGSLRQWRTETQSLKISSFLQAQGHHGLVLRHKFRKVLISQLF